uniref:Uncharacterized protein n=1 Tax=Cereibacter sphaeroides (strain ATCC 17025 / ATH 2.4.3) TaxID=349102 RepID=A4WS33_CERS5
MSESLKRKIAVLLTMTKQRGCSEAEAIAAAEKAAQLMREHGLSEADVLFTKCSAKSKTRGAGTRDRLWGSLALNTNTALIFEDGLATFVGAGPGPEVAAYLFAVLNRAIDNAIAEYKATPNYRRRKTAASRRGAVQDFTAAMVMRLREKLYTLFIDVRSPDQRASAVTARNEMFPDGRPAKAPPSPKFRNGVALAMGSDAGQRVELSHGLGRQAERLQLGA